MYRLIVVIFFIALSAGADARNTLVTLKQSYYNFESESGPGMQLSNERFVSGNKSLRVTAETEYACEIIQPLSGIDYGSQLRLIDVTLNYLNNTNSEGALFIVEVLNAAGKSISWQSEGIPGKKSNAFSEVSFSFDLTPEFIRSGNQLKMYFWNKNKADAFYDDLKIAFKGLVNTEMLQAKKLNQSTFSFDLESPAGINNYQTVTTAKFHSGSHSSVMNNENENSVRICKNISASSNGPLTSVSGSVWIYPTTDKPDCQIIFEIKNKNGSVITSRIRETKYLKLNSNKWQKINAYFTLVPSEYNAIGPDDELCMYIHNVSDHRLYADDFMVTIGDGPSPPGFIVYAELDKINEKYSFSKEHPPYPVRYLRKKEISNGDAPSLTRLTGKDPAEMQLRPGYKYLSGRFISTSTNTDQLLVASETGCRIYSFCVQTQKFIETGKIGNYNYSQNYYKADLNGDGISEILISYGKNLEMIDIKPVKDMCTPNTGNLNYETVAKADVNIFTRLLTGDFLSAGRDQLFFVKADGSCSLVSLSAGKWGLAVEKTFPKEIFADKSTQAVMKEGQDKIISVYVKDNADRAVIISFNSKSITSSEITLPEGSVSHDDELFTLNKNILAFSNNSRYYLRTISNVKGNYFTDSMYDFAGYMADRNPKFYESVTLIPGNFTGQANLLCILYNCADADFHGGPCNTFESVKDLPNCVQLYSFEP